MSDQRTYNFIAERLRQHGRIKTFTQQLGGGLLCVQIPLPGSYVLITKELEETYLVGVYYADVDEDEDEDEGICIDLVVPAGTPTEYDEAVWVADTVHEFLARLDR